MVLALKRDNRLFTIPDKPGTERRVAATAFAALLLVGCQSSGPQALALIPPPPAAAAVPVPPRAAPPAPRAVAPAGLSVSLQQLATNFKGRVGIAVRSIDKGWTVDVNGDQRLPQQSVSKLWVAITVLDQRDQGRLKLDDPVTVTREDLTLFHQPIAAMVRGDGYKTTVGDLLIRALTMSDNTANDRLLRYVGGPTAVRAMIQRKALGNIRFGPGERLLQAYTAGLEWKPQYSTGNGFTRARAELPMTTRTRAFDNYIADPPDGAAPAAIAAALARLKKGELLSADSTQWLISTMEESRTGRLRMRGAVPAGWEFGHKTGTGQDLGGRTAGFNDVGILTAPDGQSYTIAVMIGDTPRPIWERQQLMQSVVTSVVAYHRN